MVVLITGASRGLGLSLAKVFAEDGHTVYAGARDPQSGLLQALAEIKDRVGIIKLDVTKEAEIQAAAERIAGETGSLDVLINNVGIISGIGVQITELAAPEIRACLDSNLIGAMLCVKHALPLLFKSLSPVIINISSEAGSLTAHPGIPYSYTISKAAMNAFTRILHETHGSEGLRAVSVHPGRMMTDMGKPHFTLHPDETAKGILRIARGEVQVGPYQFVDYLGNEMPI